MVLSKVNVLNTSQSPCEDSSLQADHDVAETQEICLMSSKSFRPLGVSIGEHSGAEE